MDEQSRSVKASGAEAVVSVRNLSFAWGNGAPVLDIAALDIAEGERLFLRGASGSGKSTLLGLLGGVLTPGSGTLTVLGSDLGAMRSRERDRLRADHFGIVFQMFNLLPYLSVLENVLLPCRFSSVRMARAADAGGAGAEALRLLSALGLPPDVVGRPVTELSVGQQQRVAAARALMGRPELIIADEPTSALDADRRASFVDLLMKECAGSGASLVFVSHDRSLGPLFDRTLDLEDINRAAMAEAV